ncbi:hypothetical protein GYMLUDRAFT_64532 [Collybiopsis luxurians FD-317 M1]|uniref:CxC2-like cysteine cluster KDZ transposase-associated domain-containing protein n=1 Tax=Collybiopsis luxurians FD-317 M1 TaxID=944289 RepID=A0A0D0CAQ2_9AGAR|nr:hypothetical protein GYMLUDRAFT_64532 [Collybiopsis luxurians FD-317 M1]
MAEGFVGWTITVRFFSASSDKRQPLYTSYFNATTYLLDVLSKFSVTLAFCYEKFGHKETWACDADTDNAASEAQSTLYMPINPLASANTLSDTRHVQSQVSDSAKTVKAEPARKQASCSSYHFIVVLILYIECGNFTLIQNAYLNQNYDETIDKACHICGHNNPAIYRCSECWMMGTNDAEQLLQKCLFPATMDHPETVFTFDVLHQFHIHSTTSKISVYDYCHALQSFTDNVLTMDVIDFYWQFQHVSHVHKHLATVCHAGQAHGIDRYVSYCRPEPGFNPDTATIKNAGPNDIINSNIRHKYMLFLGMDGCYSMPHLNKLDDPDDIALNAGKLIFIEAEPYWKYMSNPEIPKSPDISSCSHLRMVKLVNVLQLTNTVITGVIGYMCIRHRIFHQMVDLDRGEKYGAGDYGLIECLCYEIAQLQVVLSYDIWCQYVINLGTWIRKEFPNESELIGFIDKLEGGIPQCHIQGHLLKCICLYSFNTTKGVGHSNGETIEQNWSESKRKGGSTKHMNDGHCQDKLDIFHNDWNYNKTKNIGVTLGKLFKRRGITTFFKLNANYSEFCKDIDQQILGGWEGMYKDRIDHDGLLYNVKWDDPMLTRTPVLGLS